MESYQIPVTSGLKNRIETYLAEGNISWEEFLLLKLIVSGETLPAHYFDHKLSGRFQGLRDCHIEPDWV